ncbi:hypothetical protein JTB14_015815 [Gonioctena quinquepunctata]|nr:hypothetical protein JTB14_015815 [Gonioctena quinquepunctata]
MESSLDYKIIGLPNELVGELKKFYTSLKNEERTPKEDLSSTSNEVIKYITQKMMKIENSEDFGRNFGNHYFTVKYDSILDNIKDKNLREKIKKIEHLYRAIRLGDMFRMYWESIQKDEYQPSIIIEEYNTELQTANRILGKKYPKLWKKFARMGKKYCEEHKTYTVKRSMKETLVDYFIEKNEDIEKKGTAQTPPKIQSKVVEEPIEKTELQLIVERDHQYYREQKAEDERYRDGKNRERELQKLANAKKSTMDGKLGNEGKTDKRTPSLEVTSPRLETDKDEDVYTIPDNTSTSII